MGCWTFIFPRLDNILVELGGNKARRPVYAGRPAAASPATGMAKVHQKEQARLVEAALTAALKSLQQPFLRKTG
jgi:2-oxoglutarate dehydrogenase E1 component